MEKLERNLDLIAKRGTEAWKRVKKSRDLADWWIIGEALQVLQEEAMNVAGIPVGSNHPPTGATYNTAMGELLQGYKLDDIDKGDRSRLLKMMEQRPAIEAWHRALPLNKRVNLNHPSSVLRHWTKNTEVPKPKADRKPTTLQKTEQALAEAQDELHQLKAHVEELESATELMLAEGSISQLLVTLVCRLKNRTKTNKAANIYMLMKQLDLTFKDITTSVRTDDWATEVGAAEEADAAASASASLRSDAAQAQT